MEEPWRSKLKQKELARNAFDKFLWTDIYEGQYPYMMSQSMSYISFTKMQIVRACLMLLGKKSYKSYIKLV